jgi:hypothetical protein
VLVAFRGAARTEFADESFYAIAGHHRRIAGIFPTLAADPRYQGPGGTRSEGEYRGLLDTAGFDVTSLIRLEAPRDLLVARKR